MGLWGAKHPSASMAVQQSHAAQTWQRWGALLQPGSGTFPRMLWWMSDAPCISGNIVSTAIGSGGNLIPRGGHICLCSASVTFLSKSEASCGVVGRDGDLSWSITC